MAGYVPSMYKALARTPAAHEKRKQQKEERDREKGRKSKTKLRI